MKIVGLRRLWLVVIIAAAALSIFYLSRAGTSRVLAQATVHVTPFLMEQRTVSYTKEPAGILIEQRTTARSADGSTAIMGVFPNRPEKAIRRVDFADGRSSTLLDSIRAKMGGLLTDRAIAAKKYRLANPPANCAWPGEIPVGIETIDGVDAWMIRREYGSPPESRLTEWRVSRLQCHAVQMLREVNTDGVMRKVTEVTPLYIRVGDPGSVLFDTGAAYKEMTPSELKKSMFASIGVTPESCPKCFEPASELRMDQEYRDHQTRRP